MNHGNQLCHIVYVRSSSERRIGKALSGLSAAVLTLAAAVSTASGHGVPIDVLVNSQNQLYGGGSLYEGEFDLLGGMLLNTSEPGIGVSQTTNGLVFGDSLYADVHRELLYWDGSDFAPTTAELLMENPDHNQSYTVDDTSGPQTGMYWATYNGTTGWDAHGDFSLFPSTALPGVYGLVLRIGSPGYETSQPILVAFNNGLSSGLYELGAAALEEAVFLTGDITSDGEVDIGDFTLWADSFQATGPGLAADFTEDEVVDIGDFTLWADNFSTTGAPGQILAVPEPTALATIAIGLAALLSVSFVNRRVARRAR